MKKSKIIIPAAAILALSVGASVTGTVAWFTAARSVNVTASNLAAIDTAGDLKVTLSTVEGGGATVSKSQVTLAALRDASFDGTNIYGCTTDTGSVGGSTEVIRVTGTQLINNTPINVNVGAQPVSVYAVNQWEATFTTSSQFRMFLCFEPTKSKITDYTKVVGGTNIYNAVRVMMQVTDSSATKTVVWAPYTDDITDDSVYHVKEAGMVQTPFAAATTVFSADNYKKNDSEFLIEKFANVADDAIYTETSVIGTVKDGKNTLSQNLKNGSSVKVKFTLWFEGIDSDCISSATDLNNLAGYTINKVMNLSFYSLPKSGMSGYNSELDD